ncbi:MAG: winged helix-turn-helix transcriptional regulator [Pseudomonadales bacterium]|nr:winged helix-turn-helix transcriptional regulator [Pseudomonadales bacterium]
MNTRKPGTGKPRPIVRAARSSTRAPESERPVTGRVMAGLTRALDWFDNSLQNVVASHGYQPFHRTQSMIIMHIALGVDSPAEIAREMGLTRQNVHHMAKTLLQEGVIESLPDPADPRRSRYRLSDRASELRSIALETMRNLERVLERRLGAREVERLRGVLGADWGAEIVSADDLRANLPGDPTPTRG